MMFACGLLVGLYLPVSILSAGACLLWPRQIIAEIVATARRDGLRGLASGAVVLIAWAVASPIWILLVSIALEISEPLSRKFAPAKWTE